MANPTNVILGSGEATPANVVLRSRAGPLATAALVIVTLFAGGTGSAVTFDAASSSAGNGTNTVTWSHTVAPGSDRYLSVLVDSYFADGEVTGVTFNGVALSNVGSYSANDPRASIWGLVAPDTGTHDVTVTFAGAASSNGACYAMSFTGVNQTTPTGTFASANATSTTPSVTSPDTDANGMIVSVVADYGGSTITVNSGTTRASAYAWTQATTQSGGTATTSWTCASDLWTACCVLLKPSVALSNVVLRQEPVRIAQVATTLADLTVAGTGTVTGGGGSVNGTLSATLGDVTLSGTATNLVTGTLAQTLADLTLSGTGTNLVSGTLARTLADLTLAGTGTNLVSGVTTQTLEALALSATGTNLVTGSLSTTLGTLVLSATGTVASDATGLNVIFTLPGIIRSVPFGQMNRAMVAASRMTPVIAPPITRSIDTKPIYRRQAV